MIYCYGKTREAAEGLLLKTKAPILTRKQAELEATHINHGRKKADRVQVFEFEEPTTTTTKE